MASPLDTQPDAAGGTDTYIRADAATNNYGIATTMGAGVSSSTIKRFQLRLDVSSIPSTATIVSAVVSLYCDSEDASTNLGVGLHRALTQWFEGAKDAAAPSAGQDGSTWNLRNANGSVAWAGGAGGGSGSDYAAVATATTTITASGASYDWTVTADVAAWVAGTATNYGWWGINADETTNGSRKVFRTSDHATSGTRPHLVVTYTEAAGVSIPVMMHHYMF